MVRMAALLALASSFLSFVASQPARIPDCPGCVGAGGGGSVSGGGCMISLTVDVDNGQCKWLADPDPNGLYCRQVMGCLATVTANWSGLPPGEDMEGCATIGGVKYCVEPPPNTGNGSGTGTDTRGMNCKPNNPIEFSLSHGSCGTATATAVCSECLE